MSFLSYVFSYKKIKSVKNLNGSTQSFREIRHTNFHELGTKDVVEEDHEKLTVDVKDGIIYITSKMPLNEQNKIRSMAIYTMSYPKEQLDKLKEFLKDYVKEPEKLLTIEKL
ncbi:conserved Plasmodium protein, unknown function [Plasmodium gallinaceum]|uniref:Uncharacterized protein n=1 Tax=Plasmodium gallinaceum TaxID=5849 RepID=A0A1J1GZ27_PLAGA|nr:conserved Plasmodium protein, unknown function [Plasmodium gallinaceum]CRG97717.1 conserved Plasmodium protein, unknown function [Plasmodium gallinaceum]